MYNYSLMSEQKEAKPLNLEITTEFVLNNIKQTEKWWGQIEDLLSSDKRVHVISFIEGVLNLYKELEQAAQNPDLKKISSEDADLVKAIWVISAPGTYFKGRKDDRYENKEWALWADRQRINYAFGIGRRIAEIKMGKDFKGNLPVELETMAEAAPLLVYNGRPDENAALIEAVKTPWLRIPEGLGYPKEKVLIINPLIENFDNRYNLLDQIRSFHFPIGFKLNSEDLIGIVAHAPQVVRFLYALNEAGVIPTNKVKIFPLPTPQSGIPGYPIQEIRGLTYYRFIATPPSASNTPYPYTV